MLPNKCSLITTLEVYFEWLPHKLQWGWADQRCRSCSKQIRVNKSDNSWLLKTSPDGRMHCFKVLEPYFSCFQNTFLKIQALHVAKMSILSFLSHFWLRKWLSKLKKRVFGALFPHLTFPSQMETLSTHLLSDWLTPFLRLHWSDSRCWRCPKQNLQMLRKATTNWWQLTTLNWHW